METSINLSRLGGLKRIALYGNPGTQKGRRKGGKTTVALFQSNPTLAGDFKIRKAIHYPDRSKELAEFIGIMLGDGGLSTKHQLTITYNRITDSKYAEFVCGLIKKLFSVDYHIRYRKDNNGADIIISSSNLVDCLLKQGLVSGNKVKKQVKVPEWIRMDFEYQIACLRGLLDTDGGLYLHQYYSNGKRYEYLKLCFTNRSKPLLYFVFNTLKSLKYKVFLNGDHVSIFSAEEVKRYFHEIGSHNFKHKNKFENHFLN